MRFTYQTGAQPLAGYTIQRGIDRGGFGEVYFAHSDGGKEVALKLLHQQDQDVEIRGITQCLNLKHPNLVNLFDLKTDSKGDRWVVMEYVSGSNLEDVLASFPDGLPLNEVRDWLRGMVAGVSYLHDRGIVHRDLKPANVYCENGAVKVGDVGLSKQLDRDHRRQHTQSVGTVYYMAPEVARGQYGPEVDVYALGVILYELLTGRLPFSGETTAEILMKHLTAEPDLLPIPQSLRPTLARALRKDPAQRTQTVLELEHDFLKGISAAAAAAAAEPPMEIPDEAFLPPLPRRPNPRNPPQAQVRQATGPDRGEPDHPPAANLNPPTRNSSPKSVLTDRAANGQSQPWRKQLLWVVGFVFLMNFVVKFASSANPNNPFYHPFFSSTDPFGAFHTLNADHWFWDRSVLIKLGLVAVVLYYLTKSFREKSPSRRLQSAPWKTGTRVTTHWAQGKSANQPLGARSSFPRPGLGKQVGQGIEIPWRARGLQLADSLGQASVIASLLVVAISILLQWFPMTRLPVLPSLEHHALFAAVSIVGAWLVLIGHAVTGGPDWNHRQRWYARLMIGVLLGIFADWVNQFLMVTTPPTAYAWSSVISSLGRLPLTEPFSNPTCLGFGCFFAGWMGLRRWSSELEPHRPQRLRLGSLLGAVTAACLVTLVFKFPQWYALLWALTISTTVQLVSPWGSSRAGSERR